MASFEMAHFTFIVSKKTYSAIKRLGQCRPLLRTLAQGLHAARQLSGILVVKATFNY